MSNFKNDASLFEKKTLKTHLSFCYLRFLDEICTFFFSKKFASYYNK